MPLKIAVLNNSGNVGKSTICNVMLQPRLPESRVIRIETINSDGTSDSKVSANDFIEVCRLINYSSCAIVDIGSSNIETFFKKMIAFKGIQEDFDYFIIPITPQNKQQLDSLVTLETLLDLDVDPARIRVIFNMVDLDKPFERQFNNILENKTFKSLKIKDHPIINNTELFIHLHENEKTLATVLADNRDFRTLLRQSSDLREIDKLSTDRALKRLATGVNEDLDNAFKKLNLM
ncbi:StbB family protein [Serratia symbiotica]|uniref:StbB family protein n=1 Tax=Serratia symbiotica TaxID=138074 RepID=UPI001360AE35|nr:StbB family protein [Serratia symbiotica]MBQ0957281.1 transcriptional regulator [Serratia symbiotica]